MRFLPAGNGPVPKPREGREEQQGEKSKKASACEERGAILPPRLVLLPFCFFALLFFCFFALLFFCFFALLLFCSSVLQPGSMVPGERGGALSLRRRPAWSAP